MKLHAGVTSRSALALILGTRILGPGSVLGQEDMTRAEVVVRPDANVAVKVSSDRVYKSGVPDALMDIYTPARAAPPGGFPAVVFVHGGPGGPRSAAIKSIGQYRSYGRLVASRGLAAVTFSFEFPDLASLATGSADVMDALAYVRTHASELRIDPDRLCVWVVSGGGIVVAPLFGSAPPYIRCWLFYYTVVDVETFSQLVPVPPGLNQVDFSVPQAVHRAGGRIPPVLIARAGKDAPPIAAGLDTLVAALLGAGASVDLYGHPTGPHAFDVLDRGERSREIIEQSLAFVHRHLSGR